MTAPSVFDEAPAAWALWRFVVTRIPEAEIPEFSRLMADYRDETSHSNAEKIRAGDGASVEYGDAICRCDELIDPQKRQP